MLAYIFIGEAKYAIHKYVMQALSFFFISIMAELLFATFTRKKYYRTNDTYGSLAAGLVQQLFSTIFTGWLSIYPYAYLHTYYKLTSWDENTGVLAHLFALFTIDFCYYWFHRWTHECNMGWAAHVVHHSSEDYNLVTALRQGMLQAVFGWMCYLPIALFVNPSLFTLHNEINLLYQFWVHTRCVPKMGFLEYILMTPSGHRVHHASNPQYLDKNYGGMFIFWDRLFGTYIEEQEEVVYGLTSNVNSFNVMHTQTHHWTYMFRLSRQLWQAGRPISSIFKVFIKGPGFNVWTDRYEMPEIKAPTTSDDSQQHVGSSNSQNVQKVHQPKYEFNPTLPAALSVYAFVQFILSFIGIYIYFLQKDVNQALLVLQSCYFFFTLCSIGMIFDGSKFTLAMEMIRLTGTIAFHAVLPYVKILPKAFSRVVVSGGYINNIPFQMTGWAIVNIIFTVSSVYLLLVWIYYNYLLKKTNLIMLEEDLLSEDTDDCKKSKVE